MSSDNVEIVKGVYAEASSIVTCGACGKDVYKFAKDVFYGDYREADQVKGINGFESPKSGDRTECPNCGVLIHL